MISNKSNEEDMPKNKIMEKNLRAQSEKFIYVVVSIEE